MRNFTQGVLLVCVFVIFGFRVVDALIHKDTTPLSNKVGVVISCTGFISEEPEIKDVGVRFIVNTDSECAYARILVSTKNNAEKFLYGDNVIIEGKISTPRNIPSKNGGRTFDYVDYLAKDQIYTQINSARVTKREGESGNFLVGHLYTLKHAFLKVLERALPEPHASLAAGLVLGEKQSLGSELLQKFRGAGLIHIVVLSGFNIAVVGRSVMYLLKRMNRSGRVFVGGSIMILFSLMVGGGATVIRSTIMALVSFSSVLVYRKYSVLRALVCAAVCIGIYNPRIVLYDPSFHLSFLASLGLVIFALPLEKVLSVIPEKFGLRDIIISTLATQIAVAPYLVYSMGTISLVGLLSNIFVLPLIPITMASVLFTGLFGVLHPLFALPAAAVSQLLLSYELWIVRVAADLPFAHTKLQLSLSGVFACYSFYVAGILLWYFLGNVSQEKFEVVPEDGKKLSTGFF